MAGDISGAVSAILDRPLWRCQACGTYSQARKKPDRHRRRGEECGPFESVHAERQGKPLTPRESYRQSLLAGFETCPRRTLHNLQIDSDLTTGYTGATADLGSLAHDVFAEILRTMHRHGATTIPTQEAVEVMYEVAARSDRVLPADERDSLRILVLGFVSRPWNTKRILGLEMPLEADIVCQDGVIRKVTGRPDLLLADPPDCVIIVDFKTGHAPPKQPRKAAPDTETIVGRQYLSDRGHYQLDTYGLLAFERFPAARRAILREFHLRSGAIREAEITRAEADEHVRRELGVQMTLIDRGISEGEGSSIWRPRPGSHCVRQCPVAKSCPIPVEQRGEGAIADDSDADVKAGVFAVVDAQRQQLRDGLKAYHEGTGYAPRVGDGKVMRWRQRETGSRAFGMWDPEPAVVEELGDPVERDRAA